MTENAGSVVLLSETGAQTTVAQRLTRPGREVVCFDGMEELVQARPLSSIELLVVQWRDMPNGVLLAALGRLAVEHPGLAKVAVMDSPPPLPVASYLAACGVDLVWPGSAEPGTDLLVTLAERIHEGTEWIATR